MSITSEFGKLILKNYPIEKCKLHVAITSEAIGFCQGLLYLAPSLEKEITPLLAIYIALALSQLKEAEDEK